MKIYLHDLTFHDISSNCHIYNNVSSVHAIPCFTCKCCFKYDIAWTQLTHCRHFKNFPISEFLLSWFLKQIFWYTFNLVESSITSFYTMVCKCPSVSLSALNFCSITCSMNFKLYISICYDSLMVFILYEENVIFSFRVTGIFSWDFFFTFCNVNSSWGRLYYVLLAQLFILYVLFF